jgi:Fe-Mn family superoxide dismutase
MNDRRNFLQKSAILGTAIAASTAIPFSMNAYPKEGELGKLVTHELPKLPYAYNALEPYIDAKTLEIHHSKHHQGYVNGLNNAEKKLAEARAAGDLSLVDYWVKKASFHGAGHFFHTLYWNSMKPNGGGEPTGKALELINKSFGSYKAFKDQFVAVSKSVEGSGWGVLAHNVNDDMLYIYQAEKHENLSPWNVVPVLCVDVWEHAYYLKYQNKRAEYLENWWNVVNWDNVNKLLAQHK